MISILPYKHIPADYMVDKDVHIAHHYLFFATDIYYLFFSVLFLKQVVMFLAPS